MRPPARFLNSLPIATAVVLLQLGCLLSAAVFAQESRARLGVVVEDGKQIELYEESHALLVGISNYKTGWRTLPGVLKDLAEVSAVLKQHGFSVSVLNNPTYSEFDQAVKQFIAERGQSENHRLLIYFAGHGHTLRVWGDTSQLGYLVPTDAPLPDEGQGEVRERVVGMNTTLPPARSRVSAFKAKAMSMFRMDEYAREIDSKHALFIFDSCFAGSIFSVSRGLALPHTITSKIAKPVRQFIASGTAEQTVPDESIFRAQLVEALNGEADLNKDGYVTGSELGMFLEDKVTNYSKGTQTPQYGKIINPLLDKGDFVFVLPKPESEKRLKKGKGVRRIATSYVNFLTPAAQGDSDAARLGVGQAVLRKLAQDEKHSYQIGLKAGQYLRVVIEQRGADVFAVLTGPDGKRVAVVNSQGGARGTETLDVVSESTGDYRLDIVPVSGGPQPGEYRIEVAELRPAAPRDLSLLEARRLTEKVKTLHVSGDYGQALPLAERALLLREAGLPANDPLVAEANTLLGLLTFEQGDTQKAAAYLQRALAINLASFGTAHPAAGNSYEQLGAVYAATGDYSKAESAYVAALSIRTTSSGGDSPEVATILNQLGLVYEARGRYSDAIKSHREALAIRLKTKGPQSVDVATSCSNLASALQATGAYQQAEALYTRALSIAEKALGTQHPYVARLLHNLGTLSSATGDHDRAVNYLRRALDIHEKVFGADSIYTARSLDNLGAVYRAMRDYKRAEPLLNRALALREKSPASTQPEVAVSLHNLGILYQQQGKFNKAEPLLRRALAIRSESVGPQHPDVAWTLISLGSLKQSQKELEKALEYFTQALQIQRGVGDVRGQSQTLNNLGSVYESIGDQTRAKAAYTEARLLTTPPEFQLLRHPFETAGGPAVAITEPASDGATVGATITVRGEASIPQDHYLWVLSRRADSGGQWQIQGPAKIDAAKRRWEKTISLGPAAVRGGEFEIAVIAVDERSNSALIASLENTARATNAASDRPLVNLPATIPAAVRRVRRASF